MQLCVVVCDQHIAVNWSVQLFVLLQSFVYDGKTGEKRGELGNPAHKGGIYGVRIFSLCWHGVMSNMFAALLIVDNCKFYVMILR